MTVRRFVPVVAALAAMAVPALASTATAASPVKVLTRADDGRTVTLRLHQRLAIELNECDSCGYRWSTLQRPSRYILRRLAQVHVDDPSCNAPCVGGSHLTIFRYKARHRGRTTLDLGYMPAGGDAAAKSFTVTVRVK